MIKESDYIYLHTLYDMDIIYGISKGIYKVYGIDDGDVYIQVSGIKGTYLIFKSQYNKVLPNKINKLLYRGLTW